MKTFAVVSEGPTDFAVLKNILLGWFQGQGAEPILNAVQPDPTREGESAWQKYGNWENVLRYLGEKKHRDALEFADYLIVQIDTDLSEHANFGVPQSEGGKPLEIPAMVERVADRLRTIISAGDLDFYGERIIFAVCVREMECWLLPLWAEEKAQKIVGCLKAVDHARARADQPVLNTDPKQPRRYEDASRAYQKRKTLLEKGRLCPSLKIFLEELGRRRITLLEG